MDDVIAERVSLSPNFISYGLQGELGAKRENEAIRTLTDTVSFSFTIGTTPIDISSLNVFPAFKYLVRCVRTLSIS
jgi:hypothetical protein